MKEGIIAIIGLIFMTDLCDTAGQLILKSSINSLNLQIDSLKKIIPFILRLLMVPRVWLGFALSACSLCIWLLVLSKSDLNLAFSLDSMRYVLIAFSSWAFLKEKITPLRWLGISFVVAGIVFVAAG